MKILIFALPRTGSKFVSDNVIRYFGGVNHPSDMYNGVAKNQRLVIENGIITLSVQSIDHTSKDFFNNRIEVIKHAEGPTVAKIHPERLMKYPELLSKTISIFDRVILVERRDVFNQLLSQAISIRLNWYIPGEKMRMHKLRLKMNPISIDRNWWISLIEDYKANKKIDFSKDILRVYSEDLFNASSSDFCKALRLPERDFIINRNSTEFGSDKFSLVKNYNELKEIFEAMKDSL